MSQQEINRIVVPVHHSRQGSTSSRKNSLNGSYTSSSRGRVFSVTDLTDEYCSSSVDFWNDKKTISRTNSECSVESRPESRISFQSNVTGFEDEIDSLRTFLKSGRNVIETSETSDLSRKVIELNNNLIKSKAEIDRLNYKLKEIEQSRGDDEKRIEIEEKNARLEEQIIILRSKLKEDSDRLLLSTEFENDLHQMRLECLTSKRNIQDLKIQLECKESVIVGLKDKIRDQYCEIEDARFRNKSLESSMSLLNEQIVIIKKSEKWFRDELHSCQNLKKLLQERLIGLEYDNLRLKHQNDKTKRDLVVVMTGAREVEDKARRDKENLLRKLTEIQIKQKQIKPDQLGSLEVEQTNLVTLIEMEDLKNNFHELENVVEKQNQKLKELDTENRNLTSEISRHRENSIRQELTLNMYQESNGQFEGKIKFLNEILEKFNSEKMELNRRNDQLTNELNTIKSEKNEIDGIIKKLKSDFELISSRYVIMKNDLARKTKELVDDRKTFDDRLNEMQQVKGRIENEMVVKVDEIIEMKNQIDKLQKSLNDVISERSQIKVRLDAIKDQPKIELHDKSTITDSSPSYESSPDDPTDVQKLKTLIRVIENEHKTKIKRYEVNMRTLLKKVKEHMRGRKIAEKKAETLSTLVTDHENYRSKYESLSFTYKKFRHDYDHLKSELKNVELALYRIAPLSSESKLKNLVNYLVTEFENLQKINSKTQQLVSEMNVLQKQNSIYREELKNYTFNADKKDEIIEKLKSNLIEVKEKLESSDDTNRKQRMAIGEKMGVQMELEASIIRLEKDIAHRDKIESDIRLEIKNREHDLKTKSMQLQLLQEKLKERDIYEKQLLHSKTALQKELDLRRDELKVYHADKLQLQKLNLELKTNLNAIIMRSQPKMTTNNLNSSSNNNVQVNRLDLKRANDILKRSKNNKSTLEPLQDCVESLKREMETLNSVIRQNSNLRCEISLMDELKFAENGR